MKALVCDICGNVIDKEGMYERYSLWMKDPQGEHSFWPKRMDICYNCLEKLKAEVHNASVKKIILEDVAAPEDFVCRVLGDTNEESDTLVEEDGVKKARKKRAKKSEQEVV